MKLQSIAIASLCLLAASVQAGEKAVKMKDVPNAVQAAIQAQSQGWSVHKVTSETEKGKTYYEAEMTSGAKHKDLRLDAAGALVEAEEEIQWDQLPSEVASAAKAHLGSAEASRVEMVTEGTAAPFYEIAFRNGDEKSEVKFDRSGKLISDKDQKKSVQSKESEESEDSERPKD